MSPSRWFVIWLFAAAVSLLAASCVQRETDIGRGAIQSAPEDTFLIIQGTGAEAIEWHPNVSNGRGLALQVGEANGFSAFCAMRFNPAVALPESARVERMMIRLNRNRVWPTGSTQDLFVRLREIPERWTEDSLLAGSFPDRETFWAFDSLLLRSGQTADSFAVPDTLWRKWVAQDSSTWGLLIEPGQTGVLYGYYSSEESDTSGSLGPTLEIYGWKPAPDSLPSDTVLQVHQAAVHDAYLATNSVVEDSTRLGISQGFAQRVALYFPLDSIIGANYSRVVNHARLRFWADKDNTDNLLYPEVGLLYKDGTMANKDWLTQPDSARAALVAVSSSAFNASNDYIDFDVSATVAYWVAHPDSITGFQILATEENGHLTRQLFHSPLSEDPDKRPRLKIWLTAQ